MLRFVKITVFYIFSAFLNAQTSILDYADEVRNGGKSKLVNESLLPRGTATALSCEPVLVGSNGTAKWFKDGHEVATVTSTSNAILYGRPYQSEQPFPDVGFLMIPNITKADEGKYWCRRGDTDQEGEVTNIRVAYVDQFPPDVVPIFEPSKPTIGERVVAKCPRVDAVPEPSVVWLLNSKHITFGSDRVSASNVTLLFRRFLPEDIGLYECVVSNFAGRTSTKVFVDAQPRSANTLSATSCRNFASQSAVLWFLVGSLATCCFLLCYMLSALYCLRHGSRNRITLYPALFLRSYSGLGPGFRKTVVPTADVYRNHCLP